MSKEHQHPSSTSKDPVQNIVIYRPIAGKEAEMEALVRKHYPTLRKVGLATEKPARVWRAHNIRTDRVVIMEWFEWKDGKSSDIAHQTAEVMAIWEPMGPIMEGLEIHQVEELR
jgi:hypothetical protein